MSITAFPVLARILADRGWQNTPLGTLALGCAGVQDAAGWILLTVALVASQANSALPLARIVVETAAFAAVLLIVVRPLLQAMCRRPRPSGAVTADVLAVVAVGLIACAAATQAIGLHSVLGAFCFGLAFPREEAPELVAALKRALRPVTVSVLLPIFFVTPGLSVDLTALDVAGAGELALIFAVACTGKLLGAGIGARAAGLRGREVGQLAALMNTRGLMELIVLNVGLTAGLLDIRLFSEFVVMAVATTLMTGPLLRLANKHYSTRPGAGRRTSRATSATSASEITVTARNLPP
jgi:Kef-type K+ transport system membrane component KefB